MRMDNKGFSLPEILVALALACIIMASLGGLALHVNRFWEKETRDIEDRQQGRYVLEVISRELRQACRESLVFLEPTATGYRRLEFSPRHDLGTLWAYYSKEGSILKGVKGEGKVSFTGMSLALGVEDMIFQPEESDGQVAVRIMVWVKGEGQENSFAVETLALPRL